MYNNNNNVVRSTWLNAVKSVSQSLSPPPWDAEPFKLEEEVDDDDE